MDKLVLIDGNAIMHRAYHALPPLTTRDGTVVGAVYGVVSILVNALTSIVPTHVVVAWDLPTPTFRHEKYIGYKAQRPKADAEMVTQIPLVKEVIARIPLTQVEQAGYEADDIIGTLAKKGSELLGSSEPNEVIILTGDQDTMQLVSDKVKILTPAKGKNPPVLYGPEEVRTKYGVTVAQIVDFKALIGDSSDNIPGVAGIGPVTAAKLLNEYETLEGIYNAIHNLQFTIHNSETIMKKLEAGRDSAFLSQDLSRIVTDMEIKVSEEEMEYQGLQGPTLKEELTKLGFRSLVRRIWGELEREQKNKNIDTNQMGLF